jgi:thiopurine S-methyltransferase
VTGVELSQQAIEEFCHENQLQPDLSSVDGFSCYQFEQLRVFCGDFFSLTQEQTGPFDAVYDRGSLVALPPAMRRDYAKQLNRLLKSGSQMLTISYDYDQRQRSGRRYTASSL